jgi:hypothetical protein
VWGIEGGQSACASHDAAFYGRKSMPNDPCSQNNVPKVNLLDCNVEPTDEELGLLMESVMGDVRARARVAHQALRDALALETAKVLQNTASSSGNE